MCILGEPTEQRIVLGHFGTMWARISTHGPFIHTAFTAGRLHENSILRMRARARRGARLDPRLGAPIAPTAASTASSTSARCAAAQPWRVEPHAGPHRPVPRHPRAADDADDGGPRGASPSSCAACASATPTTASSPRSTSPRPAPRSTRRHPLIAAIDAGHEQVFGEPPGARRRPLVLRRLGADALRHRDRQLRHLERPPRPRRREPRDRRAARHRAGLRARRPRTSAGSRA